MTFEADDRWLWTLAAAFWLVFTVILPDPLWRFLVGTSAVMDIVVATLLWREHFHPNKYWLDQESGGAPE